MAAEDNDIGGDCIRNWSELPFELLELILKRLAFADIVRFKVVSSSWNKAAKSYISGPFYKPLVTPWLMLPPERGDGDAAGRFFSLSEQKVYTLRNLFEGFGKHERCVIGSSYGWLVMWDSNVHRVHLYNPISRVRIILPPLGLEHLCGTVSLSSDPSYNKIFYVVIIYLKGILDDSKQIAFHKLGDDGSNIGWTYLDGVDGSSKFFLHNSLLYGMCVDSNSKSVVSVWDFGATTYPIKTMDFQPPRREEQHVYRHGFVESQGEVLLLEMLKNPISRRQFYYDIHKLHITANKVECLKVQCLQERALILNECGLSSISVVSTMDIPELETNSIYFAEVDLRFPQRDPYDEVEMYSEVKSYNLENKAGFKSIFTRRCTRHRRLLWVLPNPCKV